MQQKKILDVLEKSESEKINLSRALLEMIDNKHIVVGKDLEKCFIKKDCIYIKCLYLAEMVCTHYDKRLTDRDVSKYFKERFISKVGTDKGTKRDKNKRYLALVIDKLEEDAKDNTIDIENLF